MKRVPVLIDLPEYTQAQETSLASEMAGQPANTCPCLYNTTLAKQRSWNGSALINAEEISVNVMPLATTTAQGLIPATGTPSGKYLKDDLTWATIAGGGDMVLANIQTVTGAKTFNDTKLLLQNVANTFNGSFTNTNTANRVYTLKDAAGTIAFVTDITGTNSGTNTGDNAINTLYSGLVSNATHTGDATGSTVLTVVRINGVSMAALATGILKNTTTTGVPSIAIASDFPILNQSTTGSAATLTTPRAINGVNFDGSVAITVTADANTLSGTVLKNTIVTSSLTSFGSTPTLVTPNIGVASGTSLSVTGALVSSGGGNGYTTGAGGTVTQLTSRTTTVVLNKLCGNITMFSAAQAANAIVTFTFTNSFIAATDFLLVQHISATNGGAWVFSCVCGAGSATISIANSTAASITSATPLRFTIIKGVTS